MAGFYQSDANPSAKEYYEKLTYDRNGNIMTLKRSALSSQGNSSGLIDNLSYEYFTGTNRLRRITDSSTDYNGYPDTSGTVIPYDANGNMSSHLDKGILSIGYNFLNLPNHLTFREGLSTRTGIIRNNTQYLYRADGVKVRKIYKYAPFNPLGIVTQLETETTDYIDGFQYKTVPDLGG